MHSNRINADHPAMVRATIPVTVAPTGRAGSTVSGVLYLDDSLVLFGSLAPNANTVAAIPYSYVIRG